MKREITAALLVVATQVIGVMMPIDSAQARDGVQSAEPAQHCLLDLQSRTWSCARAKPHRTVEAEAPQESTIVRDDNPVTRPQSCTFDGWSGTFMCRPLRRDR